MKQYGAFEARKHFSKLLSDVMSGEKIIITKHGVPVAMLLSYTSKVEDVESIPEAIRTLKNLRKEVTLGKSTKALIEKGRK
jgi:prevent-host-death family protein